MFTWIPTYLKTERDLTVVGTSGYLFVVIAGSFLGYLTAGCVHDRLGRRKTFALFASLAGTALVLYFLVPRAPTPRCCSSGFPLGFFASGCFSGFGSYLSELFPTRRAGPAEASVTTSAAASARCSPASSASSRRPSGSAARSRSASSATCSRSARWRRCRRPTAGSSRRPSDGARAALLGRAPTTSSSRATRAPRRSRRTSPACCCTCTAATRPGSARRRTSASALLVMTEHSGTHIDALCHQAEDLRAARRRRGRRRPSRRSTGFTALGADTDPAADRARRPARRRGDAGRELQPAATRVAPRSWSAAADGVELREGDVGARARSARGALWDDRPALRGGRRAWRREASRWLAERRPLAVGADNLAWDVPGAIDDPELGHAARATPLLHRAVRASSSSSRSTSRRSPPTACASSRSSACR